MNDSLSKEEMCDFLPQDKENSLLIMQWISLAYVWFVLYQLALWNMCLIVYIRVLYQRLYINLFIERQLLYSKYFQIIKIVYFLSRNKSFISLWFFLNNIHISHHNLTFSQNSVYLHACLKKHKNLHDQNLDFVFSHQINLHNKTSHEARKTILV